MNLNISSDLYAYGYYVWSKDVEIDAIAKYVGRYVRHPVISNRKILSYDMDSITFLKDNKKSITDFISSLIQHIPPKNFKIVRYYGSYSRRAKFS
jgi:hypothetical protein